MKKSLVALALAAGLALASAPASATIVSGIDFTGTTLEHLETMTLAQQFIDPSTTAAGTGAGTGYGYITTVNGSTNYCVAGGGCGLYYVVTYSGGTFTTVTASIQNVQFTGTTVTIYYLDGPTVNLLTQDSATNLAIIESGIVYATLVGHGNLGGGIAADVVSDATGSLTGKTLSFLGTGLLDVDTTDGLGDTAFEAFLDGNQIEDDVGDYADLAYTESANNQVLNSHDNTTGCKTGTAVTGQWCLQGTLNTRGVGVPEPGTLALLALGLLGGGFVRRRRS